MGLSSNIHIQPILDRNGFPYLTRFVAKASVGKMKQKAIRHGQHTATTATITSKSNRSLSEKNNDFHIEAVEDKDIDDGDVTLQNEQYPHMSFSVDNTNFNEAMTSNNIPVLQ
jgi:hypothetical protein